MGGIDRLFVGIRPTAAGRRRLVEAVTALRTTELDAAVAWTNAADHHITLHYLGAAEAEPVAEAIHRAVETFRCDRPVPVVELGPGLIELGTAIAVPAAGVDGLAAAMRSAVEHLGQPPSHPGFTGHLTIGRWRRGRTRLDLDGRALIGRFPVERVELLASGNPETREGSRYTTLGSWPLSPT